MFYLHHAALSVGDLGRSESFYGLFGFRPVHRWSAPDGSLTIVHLKLGATLLELFSYRDHQPAPESSRRLETDLPRLGTKHLALGVDDADQARDFLLARGLRQVPEPAEGRTGVRYFFIQDPDGTLLEIVEDHRELASD
jgi:glyoxylase I family protein